MILFLNPFFQARLNKDVRTRGFKEESYGNPLIYLTWFVSREQDFHWKMQEKEESCVWTAYVGKIVQVNLLPLKIMHMQK